MEETFLMHQNKKSTLFVRVIQRKVMKSYPWLLMSNCNLFIRIIEGSKLFHTTNAIIAITVG